jgi:hypothetical protein
MYFVVCLFVFIYNRKQSVVQRKFVPMSATTALGKWEYHGFLISVLHVIRQLHTLDAHRPEERALAPTEQKAGWRPLLMWTFRKRNLAPAGRLVTKLTTLPQLQ